MKIVSLLLVLAMLLSFAACTDPVDPVDTSDSTSDSTTPEETTTDPMAIQTGDITYNVADYLPQETFDGEEIHIWIDDGGVAYYNVDEDHMIEGDIVQAAVIERNAAVEETYDVVFNWNRDYSGYRNKTEFRQSVLAGDEYDLAGGPALYLNPMLVYGCFYDLADNEYLDFSQPWWLKEATANMRIYDKQYTAVGYFDFQTIGRIQVYFFSDPMVADFKLGNLYDLVENGEWTWEKLMEMCEIVSEDVNQDGIMDTADRYGLSNRWDLWALETATTGYQYMSLNEEGEYVVTGVTDELLELSEKIYPVITGNDVYMSRYTYGVHQSYPTELNQQVASMFANNQILFYIEQLNWASSATLRDYGAYGILPPPKYLDNQEDYGTAASAYVSTIVSTTGNLKISSIVLEALQIESYNTLRPAYTVEALSYKYLSDPQAVEMLNLIFRNVSTDWNYNFYQAGLGNTLYISLPSQEYLNSYFQKNKAMVEQKLADFLASVESME